jgi:hypothetical protein
MGADGREGEEPMRRAALLFALLLGAAPASAAVSPEQWVLWTRDTRFDDRQPPRQWRTENWVVRGGPFDTREQCDRLMGERLGSAADRLGNGYRVTAVLESALVARQPDGASGLRRRYLCLPVTVAPPK